MKKLVSWIAFACCNACAAGRPSFGEFVAVKGNS